MATDRRNACAMCDDEVDHLTRSDARFCSNACRQRAYRLAKKVQPRMDEVLRLAATRAVTADEVFEILFERKVG